MVYLVSVNGRKNKKIVHRSFILFHVVLLFSLNLKASENSSIQASKNPLDIRVRDYKKQKSVRISPTHASVESIIISNENFLSKKKALREELLKENSLIKEGNNFLKTSIIALALLATLTVTDRLFQSFVDPKLKKSEIEEAKAGLILHKKTLNSKPTIFRIMWNSSLLIAAGLILFFKIW